MIKYWQSMQDYKYFLTESKVHFESSERNRLHTELWKAWQKLQLFDTDKAMEFLLPFYSTTGRPAKNQPQILRSFILFFRLLFRRPDQAVPFPLGGQTLKRPCPCCTHRLYYGFPSPTRFLF